MSLYPSVTNKEIEVTIANFFKMRETEGVAFLKGGYAYQTKAWHSPAPTKLAVANNNFCLFTSYLYLVLLMLVPSVKAFLHFL